MYIYFVRHGETEYNRKRLHQDGSVPLSERGRVQVEKAAEKLQEFGVTKVIASDLVRAAESGEIIASTLDLSLEENALFREVRRPSLLYGKPLYSVHTVNVGLRMLKNLANPHWHYSDEENLHDLKARVVEAVEYLKKTGEEHEHVAVVSHGFIISIFIKYMCASKDVRGRDYIQTLFAGEKLVNASVSTVTFSDDTNPLTCDWMCLEFNNHDHLKKR